jgi:hypothetical protein
LLVVNIQIRNASWSVFAALPTITSLGVAAVNGLTAVYLRGSMNASEGTLLFYSNQTITNPTYFKEVVSDTTGDSVGLPVIYEFGIPIQHMQWFQEALTVPLNNLTWTIGRSQISKSCTHIYSGNFAVLDLIMRMLKRVLSSCIQVGHVVRQKWAVVFVYCIHMTLQHATTGQQAFVLCGIRAQAKASKEVAIIYSALSAVAINDCISSLDLKGVHRELLFCC